MENKTADLNSLRIDRTPKPEGPGKKIALRLVTGAAVLLAAYFIISALFSKFIAQGEEVSLTTVVKISPAQSNASLNGNGYIVAQRKAAVASKATGRLVFLGVVEGDKVYKDQVIARIEDSDIKAALEQAKANLKFYQADLKDAERVLNRAKALVKSGSTTQVELEAAEARYDRNLANIDIAKAQIAAAEVNLENTLIRAPFNGTVLTKNADVGEVVAPFAASASSRAAVVTIADMTSLQVEVDVSESNIQRITENQNCEIRLDAYPEISYDGFVAKIVPTADRSKATVMVKVGFKKYDSKVLPEMSAKVLFLSAAITEEQRNAKPITAVASSAIVTRNGKTVVYIMKDDKAVETEVTTGKVVGQDTEILSGVSAGDKVIATPAEKIVNGAKVKLK